MNYVIAQALTQLEEEAIDYATSSVKPSETQAEQVTPLFETALRFPATVKAVSDAFTQAGLKCNPNTLKGRWMNERILPVFDGLDVPEIKTEKGLITDFGYSAIAEVLDRCIYGRPNIAAEALREEMIERYGLKPVKDSLKASLNLLERSEALKDQANAERESVALARVQAIDEIETLKQALQNLNSALGNDDDEPYELTEQEKARILKRQLRKQIAEQEYLQKVSRGEA